MNKLLLERQAEEAQKWVFRESFSKECRLKLAVFFLISKAQLFHKHDFHYITNNRGCSVLDIKQPSEQPVSHYTLKQTSSLTWLNYVIRGWFFSSLIVKTCVSVLSLLICPVKLGFFCLHHDWKCFTVTVVLLTYMLLVLVLRALWFASASRTSLVELIFYPTTLDLQCRISICPLSGLSVSLCPLGSFPLFWMSVFSDMKRWILWPPPSSVWKVVTTKTFPLSISRQVHVAIRQMWLFIFSLVLGLSSKYSTDCCCFLALGQEVWPWRSDISTFPTSTSAVNETYKTSQ